MTTHLPYPVELGGGARATHGVVQAIAASASVSVVVLTPTRHDDATIRAAQEYYGKSCRSLVCYQFPHLNPSRSHFVKTWHYLSGYPRHGFWSEEAEQKLVNSMRKTRSEVLWCDTTHEAKYLLAGKRLKCRTVLTTQNVESDLLRQEMKAEKGLLRWCKAVRWWDLRRLEKLGARWADIITGITDVDLKYYEKLKASNRVFLLPFGYPVTKESSGTDAAQEEPDTIYFFGSMDWPPNAKAALYLVQDIMPIVWKAMPEAKCFLVGKNPGEKLLELRSSKVVVTGRVPSVREYYERAALVVAPIKGVGGVKVKLMEAMAAGKAIVSTSAGATGLAVKNGKHLIIADRLHEFAQAIVDLLRNEQQRQKLGKMARHFAVEHLSPKETQLQAEKILDCLQKL